MKEFFLRLFGYKYLLNINTLEIHSLKNKTKACRIDMMAKHNKQYLTEKQMKKLLDGNSLHNGCRYCLRELDEG